MLRTKTATQGHKEAPSLPARAIEVLSPEGTEKHQLILVSDGAPFKRAVARITDLAADPLSQSKSTPIRNSGNSGNSGIRL